MTIFDTDRGIAIDDLALAVIAKAQADGVETGPSEKMLQLAKERQRIFPSKSDAQAYVDVYTDPRNVALKEKVVQENWALSGHAQSYMSNIGHAADYSNPHPVRVRSPRAGSGPRPYGN